MFVRNKENKNEIKFILHTHKKYENKNILNNNNPLRLHFLFDFVHKNIYMKNKKTLISYLFCKIFSNICLHYIILLYLSEYLNLTKSISIIYYITYHIVISSLLHVCE